MKLNCMVGYKGTFWGLADVVNSYSLRYLPVCYSRLETFLRVYRKARIHYVSDTQDLRQNAADPHDPPVPKLDGHIGILDPLLESYQLPAANKSRSRGVIPENK